MASRVLVIDDSEILLSVTVSGLTSAGLQATGAKDLATLDEALTTGPFDLILVDVNMPEMFGDDVVEYLKVQRKVSARLLLYSDLPEDQLEARAKNAGADGYVVKARGIDGVLTEVHAQLGIHATTPTAAAPTPAATEPPASPASSPAAAAAPAAKAAPGPTDRKKRVLVVDDSEMVATLLQSELSARGFEVHVADSAEKATRIILKKQTRPDLVLLDVRMPNVNGEQLCRFIKGNTLFSGIKVLLCSGESPDELRRICREAGADGYVTKDAVLAKVLASELG